MIADVFARARTVACELPIAVDVEALLTVRGLTPRGRTSANGTCRLFPAADGWVAVSLARPSDTDALPAVIEDHAPPDDPWPAVEAFASVRPAIAVADRFQLLGVPAAVLNDPHVDASRAVTLHEHGVPGASWDGGVAVDLTSLWAGPLCAHLLGGAGMRVIKVEDTRRPGLSLYSAQEVVSLDFRAESGRLRALIDTADVVIESSRPRALAQLDIDAAAVVAARPGRTWVSITGYGREGDAANKVAFGDDAAVAGGLVEYDAGGAPVFCGDAIADPLSGLCAAAAVFRSRAGGGGHLVEVAMAAVARSMAAGHAC